MRLAVGRGQLRELRDEPQDGEPQLADERGQPEPGRPARRVGDAVTEEGGEEDQAQRDGRTVQVELGQRDGQLVAESLRFRWAVTVTFPAANSDMAKYGKAQFGTHKFYTSSAGICRIAVPGDLAKERK